jgi:hypothetical protein
MVIKNRGNGGRIPAAYRRDAGSSFRNTALGPTNAGKDVCRGLVERPGREDRLLGSGAPVAVQKSNARKPINRTTTARPRYPMLTDSGSA